MRQMFVRPAKSSDAKEFTEWAISTPQNCFDQEVMSYPTTVTLCATQPSGPVMFVPIQFPAMLESLAVNPEADKLQTAQALSKVFDTLVTQCHIQGRGEIYFVGTEPTIIEYARRFGFEEVNHPVFRMKLNALENAQPTQKETECVSTPESSLT